MENKVTSPAMKGLIIGLILVVIGLVTVYTEQTKNTALSIIPILIFVGGIIWGCITYSNQMDNNVTFGNVFGHGFKITAAVIVIVTIYTLLLFLVIKPELKEIALQEARESMEKQNQSESQIDSAMAMSNRLFMAFAIGGIILLYGIVGCIAALIGGAAAKKNPQPNPF